VLAESDFSYALESLINLFNSSTQAKTLYCSKIQSDLANELEGTISREVRGMLQSLLQSWQGSRPTQEVVQACKNAGGENNPFGIPTWRQP
jgi:hypothetical protein